MLLLGQHRTMKALKIYDEDHRRLKAHAALNGRTVPNLASLLLRDSLDRVDSGEIEIGALEPEEDPVSAD